MFEFKHKKGDGWQRGKSYARWVSDVLIIHTGIALIRSEAAQVEEVTVEGRIEPPPKGLEDNPTEVVLKYAGEEPVSFAVAATDLPAMLGPEKGPTGSA